MNTTPTQSAPNPVLIQRNQRIFAAQERARRALEDVRCHAWRTGKGLNAATDLREQTAAHELSDAIADLVAFAARVDDEDES